MSKYYLVASYYDRHTRTYQDEVIVNLKEVDLSNIQSIDFFTASHTTSEVLNKIEQEMNTKEKNHLAIKYLKNKESKPDYYRVITNNPDFASITKNTKTQTYRLPNHQRTTTTVDSNHKYFLEELKKLIKIIETKDIESFMKSYPYHDTLNFLVTRYINSFYEEENTRKKDFEMILSEFSRYKTFRGWIITQEKRKNLSLHQSLKKSSFNPSNCKIIPKTIEEHEQDFLDTFQKNNHITWEAARAKAHNLSYLDEEDEREEFLESSEMDIMYEEQPNIKIHRK